VTTTTKRIAGIAAAAALLIVVVWYLAVFSPESHQLRSARAAHTAVQQQISSLRGQVLQLEALEKQIPSDKAKLVTMEAAVPDNPQLPTALAEFHAAAVRSNVTLTSLSPTAPPVSSASSGGGQTAATPDIGLSMTATGTYQEIRSFMTILSQMSRTVVLNSVNISGASSGTLTANFSAAIFDAGNPNP